MTEEAGDGVARSPPRRKLLEDPVAVTLPILYRNVAVLPRNEADENRKGDRAIPQDHPLGRLQYPGVFCYPPSGELADINPKLGL